MGLFFVPKEKKSFNRSIGEIYERNLLSNLENSTFTRRFFHSKEEFVRKYVFMMKINNKLNLPVSSLTENSCIF